MFPDCVYLQVLEVTVAVAMVVVEEVAAAAVATVETVADHFVYHCKYDGAPLGWLLCHSDIFIKNNSKEKNFIFYQ